MCAAHATIWIDIQRAALCAGWWCAWRVRRTTRLSHTSPYAEGAARATLCSPTGRGEGDGGQSERGCTPKPAWLGRRTVRASQQKWFCGWRAQPTRAVSIWCGANSECVCVPACELHVFWVCVCARVPARAQSHYKGKGRGRGSGGGSGYASGGGAGAGAGAAGGWGGYAYPYAGGSGAGAPVADATTPCKNWLNTGTCQFGDRCR